MAGKKILVVDDDPKNIFALVATLRAKGFTTASANSAEEGIAILLRDTDIGLVLLDMMMPEMDGYQAISVIRAHDSLRSLPLVAVTAQAMKGDQEKCLEAGADAYISKPIDVELLLKTLTRYLN
ncbi:response regulator [Terrimonas sp. NA20]|uniref:Response regulator n=1 Tax=Terrimonas ginsenosidimutans TaxID=2908004 RepID=A0ABS9KXZ1_9BACT|nr:response regulator [Terrimonas ginsenosidimutans]MCG2617176.1 response regulator [Terrimonas ginsenosidimutans]